MATELVQLVSIAMDMAIVVLFLIFLYLFVTRLLLSKPLPQRVQRVVQPQPSEEEETLEMIAEEKAVQAALLQQENQKLESAIKKAKTDYAKKRIAAATYRKTVEEAKEKLSQNKARLKLLSR